MTNYQTHETVAKVMEAVVRRIKNQRRRPKLYIPGNANRIPQVEDWVFENAKKLRSRDGKGAHIFQILGLGCPKGWARATRDGIRVVTPFIGPAHRALVNRDMADFIRCHLSKVPGLGKSGGRWQADVAIAHVSEPDWLGRVTLGLDAGLSLRFVQNAKYKVAIVNRKMPRFWIGSLWENKSQEHIEVGCAMDIKHFDAVVFIDEPLVEHTMHPKEEDQVRVRQIAENILKLLQSESEDPKNLPHVLQLGIGAVPDAFASLLAETGISIQGIWTELFSSGVMRLYRENKIRSIESGSFLRDKIVCGFVLGDTRLYEAMRENPHFAVLPQDIVNDPGMISLNPDMVSINSTMQVSITGEVAASGVGPLLHSGVGGSRDFATGAKRAIIAFLSAFTATKSSQFVSKVVPALPAGTHTTISSDDGITLVTEQGVANLSGVPESERAELILNIADKGLRSTIAREARELGPLGGVGSISPRFVSLTNERPNEQPTTLIRSAIGSDTRLIRAFIKKLSPDDRRSRFGGSVDVELLTSPRALKEFKKVDFGHNAKHIAFVAERHDEVVGLIQAHRIDSERFEISLARRTDLRGSGLGSQLMLVMYHWAKNQGVKLLLATVLPTNQRVKRLFDSWGFSKIPGENIGDDVTYVGEVCTLIPPATLRDSE